MRQHLKRRPSLRTAAIGIMGAIGVIASGYVAYAGLEWFRYGQPRQPTAKEADPLLDRFMPEYEVVDRNHVRVAAPAAVTLLAASELDLQRSAIVRAIFKAREATLRAGPTKALPREGILSQMRSIGWGVLAEVPDREIVVGAVTQPWLANVTFRAIPPERFAAFREPGYVKIVWTLRADPEQSGGSTFYTETRAVTTDAAARTRFRWYWARFSAGIRVIRRLVVAQVKADAERRTTASPREHSPHTA